MTSYFSELKINIEGPCYKYVLLNRTLNYNYLKRYVREKKREKLRRETKVKRKAKEIKYRNTLTYFRSFMKKG